jgi:hypothetical protein
VRSAQQRKQKSKTKIRLDFERAPSNVSGGGGKATKTAKDENEGFKKQLWTLWDIY